MAEDFGLVVWYIVESGRKTRKVSQYLTVFQTLYSRYSLITSSINKPSPRSVVTRLHVELTIDGRILCERLRRPQLSYRTRHVRRLPLFGEVLVKIRRRWLEEQPSVDRRRSANRTTSIGVECRGIAQKAMVGIAVDRLVQSWNIDARQIRPIQPARSVFPARDIV